MHNIPVAPENQSITPDKLEIFVNYFSMLKVGNMLNKSGITKTKGSSPLELFTINFNLALVGKNLILFQREYIDQRSFGDIFRACNEELTTITLIEALKRIIQLAMATMRKAHKLSEKIITAMFDVIMGQDGIYFGLSGEENPQLAGNLG